MEVQSEEYRAMKEELTVTSSDTFIVQQHGLNEDLPEAQNTYARIMVSCTQSTTCRCEKWSEGCGNGKQRVAMSFLKLIGPSTCCAP